MNIHTKKVKYAAILKILQEDVVNRRDDSKNGVDGIKENTDC